MDKKTKIITGVGGIVLVIFLLLYLVLAAPPGTCAFSGTIVIDGALAPITTEIVAYIGGNPVTTEGGMIDDQGHYKVYVYEGSDGDEVTFRIDGMYNATPTGTWEERGEKSLNLNVDTGGGPGGCALGEPCGNCAGWVAEGTYQVRDSGVGYYDQACCGGEVTETQVL